MSVHYRSPSSALILEDMLTFVSVTADDYAPIWIKLGPSDGATGDMEVYMESLYIFCDLIGVQQDGIPTLSYILNADQVSKEFCQG